MNKQVIDELKKDKIDSIAESPEAYYLWPAGSGDSPINFVSYIYRVDKNLENIEILFIVEAAEMYDDFGNTTKKLSAGERSELLKKILTS